jgi:hypothetical protein
MTAALRLARLFPPLHRHRRRGPGRKVCDDGYADLHPDISVTVRSRERAGSRMTLRRHRSSEVPSKAG